MGDGVDVSTAVSGTGEKSFTVTLTPGTYTYVCDPHSSQMRGTLTVT
jgi:plastocyanin